MLPALLWVFRITNVINWVAAALFAFLGILLVVDPGQFRSGLADKFFEPAQADIVLTWLMFTCFMVVPIAIAAHIILTRLAAMIRDTIGGIAFSEANANRLRMIAWMLLAINIIDLAFGQLSIWASAQTGEYFGWSFSLTGWLTVPLLLVLARLFHDGAAMQSDLEGTI